MISCEVSPVAMFFLEVKKIKKGGGRGFKPKKMFHFGRGWGGPPELKHVSFQFSSFLHLPLNMTTTLQLSIRKLNCCCYVRRIPERKRPPRCKRQGTCSVEALVPMNICKYPDCFSKKRTQIEKCLKEKRVEIHMGLH